MTPTMAATPRRTPPTTNGSLPLRWRAEISYERRSRGLSGAGSGMVARRDLNSGCSRSVGSFATWTAATAFTKPKPVSLSVPFAPMSCAVTRIIFFTSEGERPGFSWSMSATTPATCGVAMLVPLSAP